MSSKSVMRFANLNEVPGCEVFLDNDENLMENFSNVEPRRPVEDQPRSTHSMSNDAYRKAVFAAFAVLKYKAEEGIPSTAYIKDLADGYGVTPQEVINASVWLKAKLSGCASLSDDSKYFSGGTDNHDTFVEEVVSEFFASMSSADEVTE